MNAPDLYISVDVETDGPVPGPYSMLSLGMVIASEYDGSTFVSRIGDGLSFYAELKPISHKFDEGAIAATQIDRDQFTTFGEHPRMAMNRAYVWVKTHARSYTPVFVGYPASFDWMFVHYYFNQYSDNGSPFNYATVLDIKSMYATKARVRMVDAVRPKMAFWTAADNSSPHHALQDAVEQAELFNTIFEWRS